jgi:hypothetical protein
MIDAMETVTIERDGKTYSGHFRVDGGTLIVTTAAGRKSSPLGQASPEVLARVLLREMVWAGKA